MKITGFILIPLLALVGVFPFRCLKFEWEPMPVEALSKVETYDVDVYISLTYRGPGSSDPTVMYDMELQLNKRDDVIIGWANTVNRDEYYVHSFMDTKVFFDLAHYMEQHPDVFLDYSEFDPDNPGRLKRYPEAEGWFHFMIRACLVGGEWHDFIIAKKILSNRPVDEEIQYVMDKIRTEFLDELLQHPYIEDSSE